MISGLANVHFREYDFEQNSEMIYFCVSELSALENNQSYLQHLPETRPSINGIH